MNRTARPRGRLRDDARVSHALFYTTLELGQNLCIVCAD